MLLVFLSSYPRNIVPLMSQIDFFSRPAPSLIITFSSSSKEETDRSLSIIFLRCGLDHAEIFRPYFAVKMRLFTSSRFSLRSPQDSESLFPLSLLFSSHGLRPIRMMSFLLFLFYFRSLKDGGLSGLEFSEM